MNKTKFLMAVIIALLLLNGGILVYLFLSSKSASQFSPQRHQKGPGTFIIDKLKFDEQQKAAFDILRDEHRQKAEQKKDSIKMMQERMYQFIKTETVNTVAVDSIANHIALIKKDLDMFTFDHFRRVRLLCNEKQKQIFDGFIVELVATMGPQKPSSHQKRRHP